MNRGVMGWMLTLALLVVAVVAGLTVIRWVSHRSVRLRAESRSPVSSPVASTQVTVSATSPSSSADIATASTSGPMPDEEIEEVQDLDVLVEFDTDEQVRAYRRERLEAAGYSELLASLMADNAAIDLRRAEDLLRAGCDPLTAAKILL